MPHASDTKRISLRRFDATIPASWMSVLHRHGSEGARTCDTNRLTSGTQWSEAMKGFIQDVRTLTANIDLIRSIEVIGTISLIFSQDFYS